LAFIVSCNPWAPSICKIYGSTSLRVSYTQDPRTQRNNHGAGQL
jgi:hypothetical protein